MSTLLNFISRHDIFSLGSTCVDYVVLAFILFFCKMKAYVKSHPSGVEGLLYPCSSFTWVHNHGQSCCTPLPQTAKGVRYLCSVLVPGYMAPARVHVTSPQGYTAPGRAGLHGYLTPGRTDVPGFTVFHFRRYTVPACQGS